MKIKLDSTYLSLTPFQSEGLPNFTVIVGKNGSGKSQLVQLFGNLSAAKKSNQKYTFSITPDLLRYHTSSILIDRMDIGSPVEYRNQHIGIHLRYKELMKINAFKKAYSNLHGKDIPLTRIEGLQINSSEDITELKGLLSNGSSLFIESDIGYLDTRSQSVKIATPNTLELYKKFLIELKNSLNNLGAVIEVANYRNKYILSLEENDFLNSNISEKYLERTDLIDSRIENIFYNYYRKRHKNEYDFYRKERYGDLNSSISREEFNKLYANPIKEINEILAEVNLKYYFKDISEEDFSAESNVDFDFCKIAGNTKISLSDLSSGEKIIVGLIIRLFTSEFYKKDLKFPDLIILDEPDANLHPEMSHTLIKVLNDTFVNKIGIKVIITTHSPSTVALSPEESIFQLNNYPETFLKKIAKDDALNILTAGVPNLSIDYINHRQIFVESPTDLDYYQTLFNKFSSNKKTNHKLYFISNGYGKSNCSQVHKIVKDLRNAGNKTSYGIIDWDNKNSDDKHISVHGIKKRYSIENYIFDPLYLSILLIEKNYGDLIKDIGYLSSDNQYEIIKSNMAQKAIDFIINKLKSRNANKPFLDSTLQAHKYGEYIFNIPTWYTMMQGHELKEQLVDEFQILQSIKSAGEYEIENRLIKIIGKLYPSIPSDTIELFEKLSF